MTSMPELEGWIPFRVYFQEAVPMVDWCYLGSEVFSAPFFNQTINACLHKPSSLLFRHKTSIDTLVELGSSRPGLYPSGFIFHMSRCGSTLVGQMLASLPDTVVISEAPPIDFVISAQFAGAPVVTEERIRWLQALVSSLGQRRKGNERHYFVKFDAWHMLHWPLIRRAFADVPWIFLYRDPVEVMVSQFRQRGIHMIPGAIDPCLFQMEANAEVILTPEEYCARVLSSTCEAGLRHHDAGGLLVNYSELPEAAYSFFPEFFQLLLTDLEQETMVTAAKLNAKNPSIDFETDSARKQETATLKIREAAEKWLYPVYERLERARIDSRTSHLVTK
jgi:gluconate kinase